MTRSVLSGMCGLAARHDALTRNPVRDARSITQPRKVTPKSLSLVQIRRLRAMMTYDNTAPARDLADFVAFMLATGLRIGEASAITWDAVDLHAGTVEVRGTVVRLTSQGLVRTSTTKSTAGMRRLALPTWCVEVLHTRAQRHRGIGVAHGDDPVLPAPRGATRPVQHSGRPGRRPRLVWTAMGHQPHLRKDHDPGAGQRRALRPRHRRPARTRPTIGDTTRPHGSQDRLHRSRQSPGATRLTDDTYRTYLMTRRSRRALGPTRRTDESKQPLSSSQSIPSPWWRQTSPLPPTRPALPRPSRKGGWFCRRGRRLPARGPTAAVELNACPSTSSTYGPLASGAEWGLVNRVVPAEGLDGAVAALFRG
jgi:integrase